MRVKEPKIVEKIMNNLAIAFLIGMAFILTARFLAVYTEGIFTTTVVAMIEVSGYYFVIRVILQLNKFQKENKKQKKEKKQAEKTKQKYGK